MASVPDANESRREFLAGGLLSAVAVGVNRMSSAEEPLAPPDKQAVDVEIPKPPEKTVGFAIVGLGKLAIEEVLPAFGKCKLARPVALVSGHPDKAKRIAATYNLDPRNIYNYDNYDTLKDNPAVGAIYIILPNSMHAEFTVRGLNAGKHVLCEKPMAANPAEAEQMIAAAKNNQRKLAIAYRLRYEPFNMAAIDICRKGEIGKLKTIIAENCQEVKAPNIRLSKQLAGGPVEDVGVYCINAFRYLSGEEPREITAYAHQPKDDERFREVAESVTFAVKFPSGLLCTGTCSFGTAESRSFSVQGSKGVLRMESAFAYQGQRLTVSKENKISEINLEPVDHFAAEMDYFAECALGAKEVRTPGEDGLADMKIISAIAESVRTGRAVTIS
jgi:predicted dehydrogenase